MFCTFLIQFSKIKRISCKAASQRLRQLQFWLSFPVGVCFLQSFFGSGCDSSTCPERGSVSPLLPPPLPWSHCHVPTLQLWDANTKHGICTDGSTCSWQCSRHPAQDQQCRIPWMEALRARVHPAQQEALDAGHRVHVVLVPAALDEGSQAGGIQWDLGIAAIVWLQPRML